MGEEGGRVACALFGVVGGDEQSTGIDGRGMVGIGFCGSLDRGRLKKQLTKLNPIVKPFTSKSWWRYQKKLN
jgi:hypothetical protein